MVASLTKHQLEQKMTTTTMLVWFLVTSGYNGPQMWSPPMPTLQECERVQQVLARGTLAQGRCVQMTTVVPSATPR